MSILNEHFTVDGTLIEALAGHKSFKRKGDDQHTPPDDPSNPSVDFHGERRSNATRRFVGVELGDEVVSDETTILRFRHLLEQRGLTQAIFASIIGLFTISTPTQLKLSIMCAPVD